MPGILNLTIDGWHRLRQRGYCQLLASSEDLTEQFADLTGPIKKFVRERCELGDGFRSRATRCSMFGATSVRLKDDNSQARRQRSGAICRLHIPNCRSDSLEAGATAIAITLIFGFVRWGRARFVASGYSTSTMYLPATGSFMMAVLGAVHRRVHTGCLCSSVHGRLHPLPKGFFVIFATCARTGAAFHRRGPE